MEYIAVFTPLIGFLLAFLLGKSMGDRFAQAVTCFAVIAAAFASLVLFFDVALAGHARTASLGSWISVGTFTVDWALRVDTLSVVMMNVITIVSACVHVYSLGYMSHDPHKARFMAYLSLFTFAMLMLVSADNLLQLFFGWEGVGLASYLLIGFWNEKHSANKAAMKAFIVNRVGDFGLLLGIFAIFVLFDSVTFDVIFAQAPDMAGRMLTFWGFEFPALTLIGLLLFIGAVGKSAQLGLHTWLPDAMEGPTPVSALIHAATMVTAGVFLVARFSPLYEYAPGALMVITFVGALTAIVAATIGLTQWDIKRVIAYSTMSQLGYMFFALGVSAYGAAMFHLMTHAFFKALLFLGAGSVIHALSNEQDMRKMGGIWREIPFTFVMMWIGSLALAGVGIPYIYGLAGFYSKDMVLEAAWADHTWFGHMAYWLGVVAALLTAFYSWRLLLLTFHGKPRADEKVMAHIHESPPSMLSPLVVLATGALLAGIMFYQPFVGSAHHKDEAHVSAESSEEILHEDESGLMRAYVGGKDVFWGDSIVVLPENDTVYKAHDVPKWVKFLPVIIAVLGILLAYVVYAWRQGLAEKISRAFKPLYSLFYNKYWFDELYDALFVKNTLRGGRGFSRADRSLIDRFGPDGFAKLSQFFGKGASKAQTGFVYHYAFMMIVGVVAVMSWLMLMFPSVPQSIFSGGTP